MDSQVAARWADALESGEYAQGQGALCQDGKFCCLGVLCEVLGVPHEPDTDLVNARRYGAGPRSSAVLLPAEAMVLAGLTREYVVADPVRGTLAQMNDTGTDFKTIAALVRERHAAW